MAAFDPIVGDLGALDSRVLLVSASAGTGKTWMISHLATRWLLEWRRSCALTAFGLVRAGLLAGIIATGAVRMLKNLPDVSFSPTPTMLVDWTHLGLAVLLGLLALVRLTAKASSFRPR